MATSEASSFNAAIEKLKGRENYIKWNFQMTPLCKSLEVHKRRITKH